MIYQKYRIIINFKILLNKSDQFSKFIMCSLWRIQAIRSSQIWRNFKKWWESCMKCISCRLWWVFWRRLRHQKHSRNWESSVKRQKETKKIRNSIWNQNLKKSSFWMLSLWYEKAQSFKVLMYFWETKIWENNNHCILCMQDQENSEKKQANNCESARNSSKDEWED